MARRFSRLKYALKTLKAPGAINDTGLVPTAPAGTILAKFQTAQAQGVEYGDRAAESKTGGLVLVSINPFAIGYATDNLRAVLMSKRSHDGNLFNSFKDDCNIAVHAATHEAIKKYSPAKAVVFKKGAQVDTKKTSKITGIKYNPVEGNSYTFPFGTKASATLTLVRGAITAQAATSGASVSFKPEIYPS
jgi:hypothetical protein